MQRHISKVTSVWFYHLRRLRQIRNYVSQTVMAQLVVSLVITRNSILAGLPACRLVPLQRVQNAAARLVLNLDRRAHFSPALQQLHWLPVKHRVTFKIATLMHKILQKRCPSYLADMETFNTTYSQRRHLRSSTTRSTGGSREAIRPCPLSWFKGMGLAPFGWRRKIQIEKSRNVFACFAGNY